MRNLADVVRERPLSAEETRQLLESLLSALRVVHAQGLSCSELNSRTVFATPEAIKLRSDCIVPAGTPVEADDETAKYPAPELKETGSTPATDSWNLGVLLFQVINQRLPQWDGDPAVAKMVPPFAEIVKNCLAQKPAERWNVEQIAAALADSTPAEEQSPVAAPITDRYFEALPPKRPRSQPQKQRSIPASVYAAGVVLAVSNSWLAACQTQSAQTSEYATAASCRHRNAWRRARDQQFKGE